MLNSDSFLFELKLVSFVVSSVLIWILLKIVLKKFYSLNFEIKERKVVVSQILGDNKLFFYTIYLTLLGIFTKLFFGQNTTINYFQKFLYSISIFFFFIFLYRSVNNLLDFLFTKEGESDDLKSFISFMKSFTKFTLLILAFFQILLIWNVNITPLLASAGIAGVALALGAQQLLSNLFGGVSMFLDKSIKVGDKVIYNGKVLWVEEINIRTTKFKTLENTYLIVPNSQLANSAIENLTQPLEPKNVRITVDVAYGSDVDKVKEILRKVAEQNSKKIKNEPVEVYFYELGQYSLKFLVIFKVPSANDMWPAKCEFIETIYKEFEKEGIEIPFPVITVYSKKN
jgi:MscS family membrane protein